MATDFAPEYKLGEPIGNFDTWTCIAGGAITKGDVVAINGVVGELPQVVVASANAKAFGVATKTVANAQILNVLVKGIVKVYVTTFTSIVAGNPVLAGGGSTGSNGVANAVTTVTIPSGATTVTSSSAQPSITVQSTIAIGVALQTPTANGDFILVFINTIG